MVYTGLCCCFRGLLESISRNHILQALGESHFYVLALLFRVVTTNGLVL